MNAGPRCKLCARRHWTYEPHVLAPEMAYPVTIMPPSSVTKIGRGRPKRYENSAAKQKAYRDRLK
jgi:hypothetical protein